MSYNVVSILEKLEPSKACDALIDLIEHLTPQPHEGRSLEGVTPELLREFQERLKLRPEDASKQTVAKILELTTNELTGRLLDKDSALRAKERLGERGELPVGSYMPQFGDDFIHKERRGIRRSHVLDALRRPNKVQHLLPDRDTDAPKVSIYLKYITSSGFSRREPSALLVQCSRSGSKMLVGPVWRIFFSDFPAIGESHPPIEWLRAFVDRYGLPFFVAGKGPVKFLTYEVIPITDPANRFQLLGSSNPERHELESVFFFKISPLNVVEVGIVYLIDVTLYLRDLQRHGVPVQPATK